MRHRYSFTPCPSPGPSPLWGEGMSIPVAIGEDESHRRVELGLLDRLGRVDSLRADDRALADEAALPHALGIADDRQPFLQTLVARVEVVAAREGDPAGAQKLVVKTVDRTRCITEHAVDALAELPELLDLLVGLTVLARAERQLLLADDPRLY